MRKHNDAIVTKIFRMMIHSGKCRYDVVKLTDSHIAKIKYVKRARCSLRSDNRWTRNWKKNLDRNEINGTPIFFPKKSQVSEPATLGAEFKIKS